MKEKTLKKIKKLLAKEGLEEEKVDEIVADIEATEESDENAPNPDENGGDPLPPEEPSDPVPPIPSETTPNDEPPADVPPLDVPPQDVPPVAPQGDVVPGSIEEAVNGLVNGLQGEVPPNLPPVQQNPVTPPTPQLDPQVQDLLNKVDELTKANEGLLARVDSLEDALKNAGVLDGSQAIGDERPNLPQSENGQGNILDNILKQINGKI